jgi:hypothetical protein
MKGFIFMMMALFAVQLGLSQRVLSAVTVDSIETNYSPVATFPKALQATCEELGGTADGTIRLQGSIDGSNWVNLTTISGVYDFFPNDTLDISDGATLIVRISDGRAIPFYRFAVTGTLNDTTRVAFAWNKNRR